jgi:hypothetical protein
VAYPATRGSRISTAPAVRQRLAPEVMAASPVPRKRRRKPSLGGADEGCAGGVRAGHGQGYDESAQAARGRAAHGGVAAGGGASGSPYAALAEGSTPTRWHRHHGPTAGSVPRPSRVGETSGERPAVTYSGGTSDRSRPRC